MSTATRNRTEQKDAILEAALTHAAFEGWSHKALAEAAMDAGLDRATAKRLFPRGGQSLIDWLDQWLDRKMEEAVDLDAVREMPVRRRIAILVSARLEALGHHQEAMRRVALSRGLPQNLTNTGRGIWRTADRIWELAGFPNNAGDGLSRYSRRVLLVGIISSTFFFWLEDMSEDYVDTWAFLERRIDDALRLGKLPQTLKRLSPLAWREKWRTA